MQTHPLCPHMQLPVIPHPHQLELRAYSMEPHGISSKLLQCRQGHDAYPVIWRGNHQNSGWLAGRRVLVIPPGPPFSSSCYPPDQGLAHGICGWTNGCGLTHRRGCCPAVLLPCQSQCSSHEAVPVPSPSHSSHPLANITAFPEWTQARGLPSSPPPTSRCPSENQILQSHHGLHIHPTVTFGDCCMSR